MLELPTVRTFCGCCDLRLACIIIAAIKMVVAIIIFFVLTYLCLTVEVALEESQQNTGALQVGILVLFLILLPIAFINALFCYWFIRGAYYVRKPTFFNVRVSFSSTNKYYYSSTSNSIK